MKNTFICLSCKSKLSEEEVYIINNKRMCEDCAVKEGMYPLEHTGSRRDKISERGRYLTIPKQ